MKGKWTIQLALRMKGELITSNHPVSMCSHILQSGVFEEAKEWSTS